MAADGNTAPEDFEPIRVQPPAEPLNLIAISRRMRENPLSILPAVLFRETLIAGPSLGRTIYELSGPEEMRSVLLAEDGVWVKSPLIQRMLRPVLGDALLTAQGESWRRQRMALQPAFKMARVKHFAPIMADAGEAAADALLAAAPAVDVTPHMVDVTFAVIERAIFSEAEDFDRAEVRAAMEVLLESLGRTRLSDLLPLPHWAPRPMGGVSRRARGVFRRATETQIARRRLRADPGEDFLGLLLTLKDEETGRGLSDVEIRDTLMTFVAAGHETTALTLTWALYLLAHFPEAQDRVRAEVAEHAGDPPLTADAAEKLVFTRQVIEETLRLYPAAPMVGRQATRDTEICGRPVKKGDVALLAFYALHRHETLWDAPDAFDPDRWSETRRPSDRFRFMPFGGGPRVCIGSRFAMMEAAIVLAALVRKIRFTPVEGLDAYPVMTVTLHPRGPMTLGVAPAS